MGSPMPKNGNRKKNRKKKRRPPRLIITHVDPWAPSATPLRSPAAYYEAAGTSFGTYERHTCRRTEQGRG